MLVRIRCKNGNFRVQLEPTDDVSVLANKVAELNNLPDISTLNFSSQPAGPFRPVSSLSGSIKSLGINHGDLLFASFEDPVQPSAPAPANDAPSSSNTADNKSSQKDSSIQQHAVDAYWESKDGMIKRKRDPHMCKHGDKGMCDYCMPLEPYDKEYQTANGIKHLSFHSYLRMLDAETNKSKAAEQNYIPPLSPSDYSVKVPCPSKSHPPFPKGICTKCQPSAITLQLQQYRMVDHVEFSHSNLIDRLISFWRKTGTQRFGFLLGHYEPYEQVPMGIKAVVEAIHEPPQAPEIDGINIEFPVVDMPVVEQVASMTGLSVVGVIFTDLMQETETEKNNENKAESKVVCKRHKDSYFLSSLEVAFAATLQNNTLTPCRYSDTGFFSSRFVTCVLTGDENGDIAVNAYQVSDQGMALQKSDLIEPSVDPGVVRIRDASDDQGRYVPEIFYRYKNQYNIEVKESAKPCFPVDYLVVSLTHGFPSNPSPIFSSVDLIMQSFPACNRTGLEDQTVERLLNLLMPEFRKVDHVFAEFPISSDRITSDEMKIINSLSKFISDWNILVFISTCDLLQKDDLKAFIDVALARGDDQILTKLQILSNTESWHTLLALAMAHDPPPPTQTSGPPTSAPTSSNTNDDFVDLTDDAGMVGNNDPSGAGGGVVVCEHCTIENPVGRTDCEMCGLPLPPS